MIKNYMSFTYVVYIEIKSIYDETFLNWIINLIKHNKLSKITVN